MRLMRKTHAMYVGTIIRVYLATYEASFDRHLLIAFGGLAGLEESIEEDTKLKVWLFSFLQYFRFLVQPDHLHEN